MNNNQNKNAAKDLLSALGVNVNPDEAEEEITEADFKAKEEQDRVETQRLKEKFGVVSVASAPSPKKSPKNRITDPQKEARRRELQDVSDRRRIYEINRMGRHIKVLSIFLSTCLSVAIIFSVASYLYYNYVQLGGIAANQRNHEHSYSGAGNHIDGNCQRVGETVYICDHPYCDVSITVRDTYKGNHKYSKAPELRTDSEGVQYYSYICDFCGAENPDYNIKTDQGE